MEKEEMQNLKAGDLINWNGNLYTFMHYEPKDEWYCYLNSVFLVDSEYQVRWAYVRKLRKPNKEEIDSAVSIMKNQITLIQGSIAHLERWPG